jgi:hypothetical protein
LLSLERLAPIFSVGNKSSAWLGSYRKGRGHFALTKKCERYRKGKGRKENSNMEGKVIKIQRTRKIRRERKGKKIRKKTEKERNNEHEINIISKYLTTRESKKKRRPTVNK